MARGRRLRKSDGGDLEVDKQNVVALEQELLSKMSLDQIR